MPHLAFSTFVVVAVVAAVVEGLLLVSTLRLRQGTPLESEISSAAAPQPNVAVEALWTIVPALFLILLFAAGLQTLVR